MCMRIKSINVTIYTGGTFLLCPPPGGQIEMYCIFLKEVV